MFDNCCNTFLMILFDLFSVCTLVAATPRADEPFECMENYCVHICIHIYKYMYIYSYTHMYIHT